MSPVSRFRLKAVLSAFVFLLSGGRAGLFAQEPALAFYERVFVRSNLAAKSDVLRTAAIDPNAADFINALYDDAFRFILDNAALLMDDTDMIALVGTAAQGSVSAGYTGASGSLWKVFETYWDSRSRVAALEALAVLGKGNPVIIRNLNQYLDEQNSLFRSGIAPDYPALLACVRTLGEFVHLSSVRPLSAAMTTDYAQNVPEEAANSLWKIFGACGDSRSRMEVLDALAAAGPGNPVIVRNLNQYLDEQNSLFRSGIAPDYPALLACVRTLGAFGDMSSFPPLFSAMTVGYLQPIPEEAEKSLNSLRGDYAPNLTEVVRKNPVGDKAAAFHLGMSGGRLSLIERGKLAEAAMEITLDIAAPGAKGREGITPEVLSQAASLRYAAARALTELEWVRATNLAIRHFYLVQADYENGAAQKDRFIEAVNCLGAMGNSEAADVLSVQLGMYNAQAEKEGKFDEEVMLALVNSLGKIGDKVAFNCLLLVGLLSYPEPIQIAARDALRNLKW